MRYWSILLQLLPSLACRDNIDRVMVWKQSKFITTELLSVIDGHDRDIWRKLSWNIFLLCWRNIFDSHWNYWSHWQPSFNHLVFKEKSHFLQTNEDPGSVWLNLHHQQYSFVQPPKTFLWSRICLPLHCDSDVTSDTDLHDCLHLLDSVNHHWEIHYCLSSLVQGLVPFILLLGLNVAIYRQICEMQDQRMLSQQQEIRFSQISIAIAAVFILCHTVKWISNVWEYYMVLMYGKVTAWPNWVSYSISLSHLLITVNCSVNFFIYFIKHRQRKNSCNISQGSTVMEMDTMEFRPSATSQTLLPFIDSENMTITNEELED